MRFFADENIDRSLVGQLRDAGHDVLYATEFDPGADDSTVLAVANERGAIPITDDKDFGELVFRRRLIHAGVILVRLPGLSPLAKCAILMQVVEEHAAELFGKFTVLAPGMARIRGT